MIQEKIRKLENSLSSARGLELTFKDEVMIYTYKILNIFYYVVVNS